MRLRRLLLASLLAGAFALSTAPAAHAAWPHDPYNGNVPVCTATGSQERPLAVSDGAGGEIEVWWDLRSGSYDLYAQRLSANGQPLWAANGVVVCTSPNDQTYAAVVADGAGGVIVAWNDYRSAPGPGTADVYAQRLNASGVAMWTANGVLLCNAASDQLYPAVASDGAGGAIVAWQDFRSLTSWDVWAQRVSAAGTVQWAANGVFLVLQGAAQSDVQAVSDGAGGAIVAWRDQRAGVGTDDLYAQRVSAAGTNLWAANGVAVCTAAGLQWQASMIADGSGGAILAWEDYRSGTSVDAYVQRMSASGTAMWTANGIGVSALAADEYAPLLASDGAGGAFVVWKDSRGADYDVYAQRFTAPGFALWTANGVALCNATGQQLPYAAIPDGAGGVIVGWNDPRFSSATDIFAQRVGPTGVMQWNTNGIALSLAFGTQTSPTLVADGGGGAIAAWYDYRNTNSDIYSQRIDHTGQLGSPEPAITAVRDVPADQGGAVKLSWNASYLDIDPTFLVTDYRVWRSVPPAALANGALALQRGITTDADDAAASGKLLVTPTAALAGPAYAWEFVASTPAAQLPNYSMVVPTAQDSVAGFNRPTAFMIEGRSSTSVAADRWYSFPDSGYSVDNLAPAAPAPLAGTYAAGTSRLTWNPNHESDFASYRVYRGSTPSFTASPASLIATQPDTGYVDPAGAPFYYKLTAVDVHGNESAVASLLPAGTLDVGGAAARAFFAPPSPNPARGGSMLRFAIASGGEVRLEVLDAAGRRVRLLADGARAAGEHAVRWDARDDAGHAVAPGLYFARLAAPGLSGTRRLVVVE